MRSYRDNKGNIVEVTNEHLDTAVDIKIQLQKMSPSLRCNWSEHKRLMEENGFEDSGGRLESYRCLIKDYQKDIGKLDSVEGYADRVYDSKVELVKSKLGELYQEKREAQAVRNEMNKLRRELSAWAMLADEFKNTLLDEMTIEIPKFTYKGRFDSEKTKACVVLTDWHIGAVVENIYGNSYNFEIAKNRIEKLKEDVVYYINLHNISDLTVIFNGDAIEHVSMRNVNQAFETEFNMSQQINKATKLLIDFIVSMCEYANIEFGAISGNHDRSNGNKDDAINNDNAVHVIMEGIETFVTMSNIPRITLIDNKKDNSQIVKEFNGSYIKFVHGDKEKLGDKNKIEKHESLDGIKYKALVMGHFHQFRAEERNFGKWEIYFGSLMGSNDYSTSNLKGRTDASQGIIIIREDGEIFPNKISLQQGVS